MRREIDNEQIMVALCCGEKCKPGPNTGLCHRLDFETEAKRVMALLERLDRLKGQLELDLSVGNEKSPSAISREGAF